MLLAVAYQKLHSQIRRIGDVKENFIQFQSIAYANRIQNEVRRRLNARHGSDRLIIICNRDLGKIYFNNTGNDTGVLYIPMFALMGEIHRRACIQIKGTGKWDVLAIPGSSSSWYSNYARIFKEANTPLDEADLIEATDI